MMDRSIFIAITIIAALLLVIRVTLRNRKKPTKETNRKTHPYEAYHVYNNLCIFREGKKTQLITARGKVLKQGHLYIFHLTEPIVPEMEEVIPVKFEDYDLVNGFKVNLETAMELLARNPKSTKIIDVRRKAKYKEAHIPSALSIPTNALSGSLDQMGKNDILIFYGEKQSDVSEVIEALNQEMYTTLLDGGTIKDYTGPLEKA